MTTRQTIGGHGVSCRKAPFTLSEANRSLPLVTRIVRDIVQCHQASMELQGRIDVFGEESAKALELTRRRDLLLEQLGNYVDELAFIGAELKDPETGLVDFPARLDGREIYLCWRLGETTVSHWHELHGGFSGRQPVSTME